MGMGFWAALDRFLILFYRITGDPVVDFFLGTFLLALLTVVVGEFTISLVFRANKKHLDQLNARLEKMHRLSLAALEERNEEAYRACNKEANEAFGKVFFNAVGLSAASLWPVFFALAWMQERFGGIPFPIPFTPWAVNYVFIFLACYVMARVIFGRVMYRLPYFKHVKEMLRSYD